MGDVLLRLPSDVYEEIRAHLLPGNLAPETAGFIFVVPERQEGGTQVFEYVEWYPVPPDGFVERSPYHLELTDETRAEVIKRAHDLGASVVELHSHTGPYPAAFSPDDQRGLREFVPHIWWRLRKRPYFAMVVTEEDFDGLAWMVDPKEPQHLGGIVVDGEVLEPTRLSSLGARDERYDRSVRFFGLEGQDRLSTASVAVVGIGGLGTHVVQQLALLGVGRLVLIDDEEVDNTNRNRYVGIRHDDPVPGMPKVSLGLRIARETNPGVEVVPIRAPLRSQAAFGAVIDCDYVFGCLDNEGARLILNELCLAYAKPYFDLASDILDGGSRYGGRVCFVGDNNGCLVCRGELDTDAARVDLMNPEQRRDHEAIYGVPMKDLGEVGPSVVSINGVIASLGVTEFMLMASGVRPPNGVLRYHGQRGIVSVVRDDLDPTCYHCSAIRGRGAAAGVERYLLSAEAIPLTR